jgi:bromodomain-containing factor 1
MDLSTISTRLESGYYDYPSLLRGDLALIFTNCFTYNGNP